MKELIEKIVERLEEQKRTVCEYEHSSQYEPKETEVIDYEDMIEIVNKLAEEYKDLVQDSPRLVQELPETNVGNMGDLIKRSDVYRLFDELYNKLDGAKAGERRFIKEYRTLIFGIPTACNDGWIPVSSGKLPEDCDNRFYMCIVENHEEDLPMFCQYDEDYGFGFWHDIYDEHTLGFVDSEFKTNEELGYEKVIAWQPLPPAYQPKGE